MFHASASADRLPSGGGNGDFYIVRISGHKGYVLETGLGHYRSIVGKRFLIGERISLAQTPEGETLRGLDGTERGAVYGFGSDAVFVEAAQRICYSYPAAPGGIDKGACAVMDQYSRLRGGIGRNRAETVFYGFPACLSSIYSARRFKSVFKAQRAPALFLRRRNNQNKFCSGTRAAKVVDSVHHNRPASHEAELLRDVAAEPASAAGRYYNYIYRKHICRYFRQKRRYIRIIRSRLSNYSGTPSPSWWS